MKARKVRSSVVKLNELSPIEMKLLGANNLSKRVFSSMLGMNGWVRAMEDNTLSGKPSNNTRNVVEIAGERWAVVLNTGRTEGMADARQVYADCVGFLAVDIPSNKVLSFRLNGTQRESMSRRTPSGTGAYSIKLPLLHGVPIKAKIPCIDRMSGDLV